MARPGAFSANFAPEVLNRFRGFCASRGEKYTKVLQELAAFEILAKIGAKQAHLI